MQQYLVLNLQKDFQQIKIAMFLDLEFILYVLEFLLMGNILILNFHLLSVEVLEKKLVQENNNLYHLALDTIDYHLSLYYIIIYIYYSTLIF